MQLNIEELRKEAHARYDEFVCEGKSGPSWAHVFGQLVADAVKEEAANVCARMQHGWPSDDHLACATAIRLMAIK